MVAGQQGLALAQTLPHFTHITEDEDGPIAVLSGDGWRVRFRSKTQVYDEEVVAWLVDRDGWATPVTPDWDGPAQMCALASKVDDGAELLLPPGRPPLSLESLPQEPEAGSDPAESREP
jgi:hypothetical protein